MSLSNKVIKSGFWLQLSRIIQVGSNFIVSIILARLLAPEHFGLIGIISIYVNFIMNFTNISLTMGIIQKQDITEEQLSSVFWINFFFGLFGTILVASLSPLAASFYNEPELIPLILISSITFFITPFFQIHRRLLEKKLDFSKISKIEVAANVGAAIVSISLAYSGFGVYSLVWQAVSLNIFYLVLLPLLNPWKPLFRFNFKEVKELIIFSLKMKGTRIGSYFERNIDSIFLSKLFDTSVFGFYTLAHRIMYFPIKRITSVFYDILFPAFSSIQADLSRVKTGYLKSIQLIAIVSFPVMLLLSLYAEPFVLIVFGKKWLPVTEVLAFLTAAGAIHSISMMADPIFPALNKPGLAMRISIYRALIIGVVSLIGGLISLKAAGIGILIGTIMIFVLTKFYLRGFIEISFKDILMSLAGPFLATVLMILVLIILKFKVIGSWTDFIIPVILGSLVYIASLYFTNSKDLKYFFKSFSLKAAKNL